MVSGYVPRTEDDVMLFKRLEPVFAGLELRMLLAGREGV